MGRLASLASLCKGEKSPVFHCGSQSLTFEGPHPRNGTRHYCEDRPWSLGSSDALHRSIAAISRNELQADSDTQGQIHIIRITFSLSFSASKTR